MDKLTFAELCELERGLRALYEAARAVRDDPERPAFCANEVWYGCWGQAGLRDRLCNLVGFDAGYEEETPNVAGIPNEGAPVLFTLDDLNAMLAEDSPRRPVDPRLMTMAAYDVAYHSIADALPPCRNCWCLGCY